MDSHDIRSDKTALSRLDRGLFRVESLFNTLAGVLILVLMMFTVVNIVSRKLLNLPIYGFIDFVVLAVPFIAFLGLAHCQRLGGHIRMDILIGKLKGRGLWAAELVTSLAGIAVIGILVFGSWDHVMRALRIGDSTPIADVSTWPSKAVVTLGLGLILLRLVLQTATFARAFALRDDDPAGIPPVLDVAAQAKREAESSSK